VTQITDSQTATKIRLERALDSAVVLSWNELMTDSTSGLIHVEYQAGDDGSIDFLKIWASTTWGEWKLVCEFWIRPLWSHATGIRFCKEYHSVDFARTLEQLLGRVGDFAVLPNLHGLVQVFPPTEAERKDAQKIIQPASVPHASLPLDEHVAA
jgi:hypothetical protein